MLILELRGRRRRRCASRQREAPFPLGSRMMHVRLPPEHLAQQPRVVARERFGRAIVRERVVHLVLTLVNDRGIELVVRIHWELRAVLKSGEDVARIPTQRRAHKRKASLRIRSEAFTFSAARSPYAAGALSAATG